MSKLADILKKEYQSKNIITGSVAGLSKKTLEAIDLRNLFFSGSGIASVMGKKIFGKGYSATREPSSPTAVGKISASDDILTDIKDNSIISAKNSMSLPLIASQINIMQKNVAKLVKLQGETPSKRADSFFTSAKFRENAYEEGLKKGKKTPTAVGLQAGKKDDMGILGIMGLVGGALLLFGDKLGATAQIIGGVLIGLVALKGILMAISVAQGVKSLFGLGAPAILGVPGKGKAAKGKVPAKFGKMGLILGGIGGAILGSKYLTGTQKTEEEGDEGLTPVGGAIEGAAAGVATMAGVGLAKKFIQPKLDATTVAKGGEKLGFNEKAGRFTKGAQFTKGKDLPLGKILEKMRGWYLNLAKTPGLRSFIFRKIISKFGFVAALRVSTFLAGLAAAPFTAGLSGLISLASWGLTAYTLYEIYDWLFGEENNSEKLEELYKMEENKDNVEQQIKDELKEKATPEVVNMANANPMGDMGVPDMGIPPETPATPTTGSKTKTPSKIEGNPSEMANLVYSRFREAGFSDAQARAAVANAQRESGLNPNARNNSGKEDSVGLFQMNRKGGLGDGYSVEELQDPEFNTQLAIAAASKSASFKKASTVEDAIAAFVKDVERPANQSAEIAKRIQIASNMAGGQIGTTSIALADANKVSARPTGGGNNVVINKQDTNVAQGGASKPASVYDPQITAALLGLVT